MRKVFILNDGGHDYEDAKRFGELVFCTRNSINKWDIAQMYRELGEVFTTAASDDFIMLSGLTSLCSVATALMVEKFGEVHFLVYKDRQYIQRDLVLHNMMQLGDME